MWKKHAGLAGERARHQRLAGAGRAYQQDTVRRFGAESPVLLGATKKLDQLGDLALGVILTSDVGEGHLRSLLTFPWGRPAQEVLHPTTTEHAAHGLPHPSPEKPINGDQDHPRQEHIEHTGKPARPGRLALHLHALLLEQRQKLVVADRRDVAADRERLLPPGPERKRVHKLRGRLVASECDLLDLALLDQLLQLAVRDLRYVVCHDRHAQEHDQQDHRSRKHIEPAIGRRVHRSASFIIQGAGT